MTGQAPSGQGTGKEGMAQGTSLPGSTGSALNSLEITPADARRNSTLYLRSRGFNLQDVRIEWLKQRPGKKSPT